MCARPGRLARDLSVAPGEVIAANTLEVRAAVIDERDRALRY
ncbi:hypothetical protein [Streptomyces sp. PTD5-9]